MIFLKFQQSHDNGVGEGREAGSFSCLSVRPLHGTTATRLSASTVFLNPLSPNSDENKISLYIINTCLNIQVTRIKELITEDRMS